MNDPRDAASPVDPGSRSAMSRAKVSPGELFPPPLPPKLPPRPRAATPPPLPRREGESSLLNPAEIERFGNLLLFAKSKVDGYFTGRHRSPYYGSNVEFADYKEYTAGEDIANMDWRVYGRTRRLFLRKYEEETDMAIYLLVDTSASMRFRGTGVETKWIQAAKIAAALAYLMIHQADKVSLTFFANKVSAYIPPAGTRRHLYHLLREMEGIQPAGTTGIDQALHDCASIFRKRGRIVILSDFLGDLSKVFDALAQFVHRKFEVLLLQVLDPDELTLPDVGVARFRDMETAETIEVEPDEIRRAYRESMDQLTGEIARQADRQCLQYARVDTSDPYLNAIEAYLGFRGRKPGRR